MDWASVISVATGVGLALFGIALSVKFYLETAGLERRMVEMLAKIETLSVSTQQVQNELIRSAWERMLPGRDWDVAVRSESMDEATAEEEVSSEEEGGETNDAIELLRSRLRGLGFDEYMALLVIVSQEPVPRTIVRLSKQDPMGGAGVRLADGGFPRWLPLEHFEEALRALVEARVVETVRADGDDNVLFVRFTEEFRTYWGQNRHDLVARLSRAASNAWIRERFDEARPVM